MSKKAIISNVLKPIGWLFGFFALVRRFLYKTNILKSRKSPLPIITIGNLAVGGTGKTPHSQYVINTLKDVFQVAFLSRGYGRKSHGYKSVKKLSAQQLNPQIIGDEPFMIYKRNPEIPLAVDANRYEGLCNLRTENPEIDVVILDDAYQHLKLKKGLNILLTEFENPYYNDFPMPAGRLREFPSVSKYADILIVTKTPEDHDVDADFWRQKLKINENQYLFFTKIKYEKLQPVTITANSCNLDNLKKIILLTAIAHPDPLKNYLIQNYTIEKHISYSDHHYFSSKDMTELYECQKNSDFTTPIVTTEKDWARMQIPDIVNIVSLLPIFVIRIEVEFLSGDNRNMFNNILFDYVRREKKNNSRNS